MKAPALVARPPVIRDVSSREGAYALAKEIKERWAELGHIANCRVIESPGTQYGDAMYHVRTDMVGGLPRKMANKLAA